MGVPKVFFLEGYVVAGKTIIKANYSPTPKGFPIPSLFCSRPMGLYMKPDAWSFCSPSCCDYAELLPGTSNAHGGDLAEASLG